MDFRRYKGYSGAVFRMASLSLLFVIVFFNGCNDEGNLVQNDNIDSIQVLHHLRGNESTIRNITAPDKIASIVTAINSAKSEPAYFKALLSLKIFYKGGKHRIISCNGNHININGRTYVTNGKIDLLGN